MAKFTTTVQTPYEALRWMTEYTLATLEGLIERKSSSKTEIKRHIEIAQRGINWVKEFGKDNVDASDGSRVDEILLKHKGDVKLYLEHLAQY